MVITSEGSPEEFIDGFCSVVKKKFTEKMDLKKLIEQELRKDLLYIDSNVFLYPIITVGDAKRSRDLLLKIALGEAEAYTSVITWGEIVWIVRKVFDLEYSLE